MTAERPVSFPPRAQPERDASEDAKAAALRGASLAFGKPILKPKPDLHNYSGNNGALAAATKSASRSGNGEGAGGRQRLLSMQELLQGEKDAARLRGIEESSRIRRQNSGSSVASERVGNGGAGRGRGRGVVQQRPSEYSFGTNDGEGGNVTKLLRPDQSRSTSFIAATLAASRSASVSPNPTGTLRQPLSPAEMRIPPRYGSRSPSVGSADSSRGSLDQALDTRPIPPTGSLIGMFEQNAGKTGTGKTPRFNTPTSMQQTVGLAHSASATPMEIRSPNPLSSGPRKAPPQLKLPQPQIPQQPLTQATSISTSSVPSTRKAKPSPEGQARKPSLLSSKPIPIPSKSPASAATSKVTATLKDDDASSDDSFVSAPDYSYKPSWRAELASQNGRLTSASIASVNSAVTVDSLANAIVASSLASSRAGSPSKYLQPTSTLYPPLSPPQRTKHHHHTRFFHNGKDLSRTPSPSKNGNGVGGGMLRTTMRKVKSKEEIGEGEKRRGKKNLVKKHPNKHHEGDRKRWRDSITERERKRYEAVWASNRGLYTSSSPVSASTTSLPITNANGLEKPAVDPPSEVCSLVVRDIFSRSRLNTDVLEEAYALVDRRGIGSLGKEEFVVGLWLVDQRLKGRKLPIRVSESVWKSVGVLSGIKVRKLGDHIWI